MLVPTTFTLTVTLLLDGFGILDGSGPVLILHGTEAQPFPSVSITLQAFADPRYDRARTILAENSIDGVTRGVATTSVDVRPAGEPAAPPQVLVPKQGSEQVPGRDWAIFAEGEPDVVIMIGRGNDEAGRRLQWSVKSPHPDVPTPPEPVPLDLDESTQSWARRVMRGVEQRGTAPDLAFYLRGISRQIGDQIPEAIWSALEAAARIVPHPAVLLTTAEPFIPWELARVPRPWDPDRPALLGAQAHVGRWSYREQGRPPSPAHRLRLNAMAVVKGEYSGSSRLPEAEAEADDLRDQYHAHQITADLLPVLACLQGQPEVDILHFAVHGRLDVTGLQDGIVMNDRTYLDPESILGADGNCPDLIFLNACQLGQQQEMLGDAAGVVPSFLRIGAQAVIAPLWKVDDAAARAFAQRFYTALFAGRTVSEFLAEERSQAVAAGLGTPEATVMAYLFFGHPRLTAVDVRNPAGVSGSTSTVPGIDLTNGALHGPSGA
jgi:hypothetical protein